MTTNINYEKLRFLTMENGQGQYQTSSVERMGIEDGVATLLSGRKLKPFMKNFLEELEILNKPSKNKKVVGKTR